MGAKMDNIRGKAKEAVGDITDNSKVQRNGKADQAAGTVKEKAEKVKGWVEDKVDDVKDKLKKD